MKVLRARTARDEEGQIILPLLVVVLVLFAVALGMFGFGEASDSRGKAQKGTDAAALAAAKTARDAGIAIIGTPLGYGAISSGMEQVVQAAQGTSLGCAEATAWAASNSSVLAGCTYQGGGRFHTKATSLPSAERHLRGNADATADMNLPQCAVTAKWTSYEGLHEIFTCTGARGGSAFVHYLDGISIGMSPQTMWQSTFRIRLVE